MDPVIIPIYPYKTDWKNIDEVRGEYSAIALAGAPISLHKLFLRHYVRFALSVLFFWTGIPTVCSLIDCVRFLFMPNEVFVKKYPNRML